MKLSKLLKKKTFPSADSAEEALGDLQLKMLRIQQGIWHSRRRVIVIFEGFDAAGKGGAIRRLTETLDPRGLRVHPIGPPTREEREQHYLQRFWRDLPAPGTIAIFDRSWYGRVLVERVEKLIPKKRWHKAFAEINSFEAMLAADGIDLVKVFLAIHPDEQLKRFEDRLHDPYKQWKLTDDDLEAHRKWNEYVKAADSLLTETRDWNLIPADSKEYARRQVLKVVTRSLEHHEIWIEGAASRKRNDELRAALKKLKRV
jgi:polyphosphate kinase 2 (PPK2 family)